MTTNDYKMTTNLEESNTKKPPEIVHKTRQHRLYFFTWNNYTLDDVTTKLQVFLTKHSCLYVMQEEIADSGTRHIQGCLKFRNPRRDSWQKQLPQEIHWEYCRSWRKACLYCSKADSRIGLCWTNIKDFKFQKQVKDPLSDKTLYGWQDDIIKLIKTEPDDRSIYWFWELQGNAGKSSLCKHLVLKHNAIVVGGRTRDALYAISERLKSGKDVKIVIFDIPRGCDVNYLTIENIKNGCCFAPKYESNMLVFDSPHILCFSNNQPCLFNLSLDRWKIYCIDRDKSSTSIMF